MPEMSQDLPNVDAFSFGGSGVNLAAIARSRNTVERKLYMLRIAAVVAGVGEALRRQRLLATVATSAEGVLYQLSTLAEYIKDDAVPDDEWLDVTMRTIADGVRGLAR
jgi:hypothetical protein